MPNWISGASEIRSQILRGDSLIRYVSLTLRDMCVAQRAMSVGATQVVKWDAPFNSRATAMNSQPF